MGLIPGLEGRWHALMVETQQGNCRSYETLLGELTAILRAWGRRRVRTSPEVVEDLVQDILLNIHRSRHTWNPNQAFGPWLFAIARHRLVDMQRQSGRRQRREQAGEPFEAGDPSGVAGTTSGPQSAAHTVPWTPWGLWDPHPEMEIPNEEMLQLVNEALATLPPKQRQAIELLKLQDLSVKEASAVMQVSESSLKVLAHRGYKAIRRKLGFVAPESEGK